MDNQHKHLLDNLQIISEEQLQKLEKKYGKGCGKIYHQPGVYTAKGDALYDFTCDPSHRCYDCKPKWFQLLSQRRRRNEIMLDAQNKSKSDAFRQVVRSKYFQGKPGCGCKKDSMCKDCFQTLQNAVTKWEKGCGATWIQDFGGMAAGPGWVTCKDNNFLCQKCDEQLAFINSLNKQYPYVKLQHMPEQQKMFWSPKSYPYYSKYI